MSRFLLLIFLSAKLLAAEVPEAWKEWITLQRERNVAFRQDEIMKGDALAVVPIYHFEVPYTGTTAVVSDFIDTETKDQIFIKKGDVLYQRVFVSSTNTAALEQLKARGLEPHQRYFGTRLQSRGTWFIWDPASPTKRPLSVKMSGVSDGAPVNGAASAQVSVVQSELAEKRLREGKGGFATWLPERAATFITGPGLDYANTFRTMEPIAPTPPGTKLFPLHGLLGSAEHLAAFAKAAGYRDGKEWVLKEYIPKLARYFARMSLGEGIYVEGHTQNLSLLVDPKTGRIAQVAGQDAQDLMFDHYARIAGGHDPRYQSVGDVTPREINKEFHSTISLAEQAGGHFFAFGSQAVLDLGEDAESIRARALAYADAYVKEAEVVLKKKIALPPDRANDLAKLRAMPDDGIARTQKDVPLSPKETFRDFTLYALAAITQDVANFAAETRAPKPSPSMFGYEQTELHDIFKASAVSYFYPKSRVRLGGTAGIKYAFDGKGIMAYDVDRERVIAYAYPLSRSPVAGCKYKGM